MRKTYTDEERKIRKRESNRRYAERKRATDPTWLEKERARVREAKKRRYHETLKHDPEIVAKQNAATLQYYHTKVRPFADKMAKRRERIQGYQAKRRIKFNEKKIQLQQSLGGKCVVCGIDNPQLLDFDHIDPATKTMLISQSLHHPIEELLIEVQKCQLLCPNCHRLKTIAQSELNAYKNREFRNKYRTYFRPLTVDEKV